MPKHGRPARPPATQPPQTSASRVRVCSTTQCDAVTSESQPSLRSRAKIAPAHSKWSLVKSTKRCRFCNNAAGPTLPSRGHSERESRSGSARGKTSKQFPGHAGWGEEHPRCHRHRRSVRAGAPQCRGEPGGTVEHLTSLPSTDIHELASGQQYKRLDANTLQ